MWQPFVDTSPFFDRLSDMEKLMDAEFTFSNHQVIRAHKIVLAGWSPVFYSMFYGREKMSGTISITDTDPKVFQKLIDYMYNRPCDFNSIPDAVEYFTAAEMFGVPTVHAEKFFMSRINFPYCIEVYEAVKELRLTKILKQCLKVFELSTEHIINSPAFLKAKPWTVNQICAQERITASDIEVCLALHEWLNNQTGDRDENLLKIHPSLEAVRFLAMEEFDIKFIPKLDIITEAEKEAIVYHITNPGSNDIPYPFKFNPSREKRELEMETAYCERDGQGIEPDGSCSKCGLRSELNMKHYSKATGVPVSALDTNQSFFTWEEHTHLYALTGKLYETDQVYY